MFTPAAAAINAAPVDTLKFEPSPPVPHVSTKFRNLVGTLRQYNRMIFAAAISVADSPFETRE